MLTFHTPRIEGRIEGRMNKILLEVRIKSGQYDSGERAQWVTGEAQQGGTEGIEGG